MVHIKRIGPKSLAKVVGLGYTAIGLLLGVIVFVVFLIFSVPESTSPVEALFFGIGAPLFIPLFYGIIGFIGGAVSAWFYNLIARRVGGVEIELGDENTK